ncbi:MAG: ribbon-helix-helix domain-containing protein [Verrucomicrobiota bacterium]|nr:ribbon-helix-helix domain-containing protein [Verrucomicrobiota bacterium]
MQTLTLKIPPELSDWLNKRSKELNRPKSEIVREALRSHRGRKKFDSVTSRAGELVGKFASGRKDSSHKKHLKGFGSCKRS